MMYVRSMVTVYEHSVSLGIHTVVAVYQHFASLAMGRLDEGQARGQRGAQILLHRVEDLAPAPTAFQTTEAGSEGELQLHGLENLRGPR